MEGYTPVFGSLFQGSLCGQWPALPVFCTLLPLCNRRGEIDYSFGFLSRVTGWPEELLRRGIEQLEAPDPYSRTPDDNGVRLVRIRDNTDWGWRVLNHGTYREKARKAASDAERAANGANAARLAARRAATRDDPTRPAMTRVDPPSDSDTNTDSNLGSKKKNPTARSAPPEFDELRQIYPKRAGDQGWPKALRAATARLAEGHTWTDLLDGTRRYAAYVRAKGSEGSEYVKQAATFLGPDKHFLEAWDAPPTKADLRYSANVSVAREWAEKISAAK